MTQDMLSVPDQIFNVFAGSDREKPASYLFHAPRGHALRRPVLQMLGEIYGTQSHPDLRIIAPEGAADQIKVEAVRQVLPFLISTPSGSDLKTLLVLEAHRLNESAANALLKPLEEPNKHTRIVLVTDRPGDLLVTIRSRCAHLSIPSSAQLAEEDLADRLRGIGRSVDQAGIRDLLALTSQDPALACEVAQYDLLPWLGKFSTWLSQGNISRGAPPLPPLTGKSAPSAQVVLSLMVQLLSRIAAGEDTLEGWTEAQAATAAWQIMEQNRDIGRIGLDAKARIHLVAMHLLASRDGASHVKAG